MTDDTSMKRRRFFSANSIERALVEAASYHGVAPERIAYRPVEKRHGFVKNARRAVIEVDPENPLLPEGVVPSHPERPSPGASPRASASREDTAPRPAERRDAGIRRESGRSTAYAVPLDAPGESSEEGLPLDEQARRALERLLKLGGLDVSADLTLEAERLELNLHGKDEGALLEDEAELLQAIEYLLPRLLSEAGEGLLCRADCGGYRRRREEELEALAKRTADLVRASGSEVTLDPLNPAERRLIHMALAGDPDVETESDGEGFFKRLTIRRRP